MSPMTLRRLCLYHFRSAFPVVMQCVLGALACWAWEGGRQRVGDASFAATWLA